MILFFFNTNEFCYKKKKKNKLPYNLNFQKYKFERDRENCIASFLIKIYLISYLNLNPERIILKKNFNGKPYIQLIFKDYYKILNFNVSHDYPYLCLYYDNNKEVGIDIVNINRKINIDRFQNILHPIEIKNLNMINSPKNKKNVFFKYWAFKEAYTKLKGVGIKSKKQLRQMKFNSYSIKKLKNLTVTYSQIESCNNTIVCHIESPNNYVICLSRKYQIKFNKIINIKENFLYNENFCNLLLKTNIDY
ncbi:4'-phosphopantetheinyl transferase superfamily [seawater metagenome]|uniref:4'-phosphopantetheinyl transferase superfamily n=1 Tax=seawater metagenome TaxID=1561972 RepID=A0A5E8CHT3_9ZZZZ